MSLTKPTLSNLRAAGTTVGDVYFPQTKLLLPFDGANAATTTSDLSNRNGTVSFNGNASLSTAQSKFGGSSMYFDGTGDYLRVIDTYWNSALSSGDFTMECWARFNADQDSVLMTNRGGSNGFSILRVNSGLSSGQIYLYWYAGGWVYMNYYGGTRTTVTENVWYHVAFTRSGNTWRLFLNGTVEDTLTSSSNMTNGSRGSLDIGQLYTAYAPMAGWIDDLRITVGVARYTSNFTPPTSAHSTSAGDVNKQIIVNSAADGVAIGTGGINQARIAKAWVNFNGTGTVAIRGSYNVSSITDNGAGIYTVNFSSNMTDTNYAVSGSVGGAVSSAGWLTNGNSQDSHTVNNTTSSCRVSVAWQSVSGHFDAQVISVNIFGN